MNENLEFNENPSEKSILFSTLTGDELSELKAELGLSMSTDTLLICQSYYREHGYNEISASVLHFLDTLAVCTKRTADNILINEVEADSREIFETYMDLMRKQSIISKSESAPLSLSSALEVANRYATITGKGTPRELYISGISTADGAPVFSTTEFLFKDNVSLAPGTAFVLALPAKEMSDSDYSHAVEKLVSCDGFSDKILLARRIDHGGIANALSRLSAGILINIHAIPNMPKEISISHLASEHYGNFILALQKSHLEFANAIAEYYGLSLYYFAKSISGEKLLFLPSNNINATIDTKLISTVSNMPLLKKAHIKAEDLHAPVESQVLFMNNDATGTRYIPSGTIHLNDGAVSSIRSALLGEQPFSAAINTAIGAVLPILACGVSRADIALKVKYTLSNIFEENTLGTDMAAILGIYRVMSELYLFGTTSVEYTDKFDPALYVAAHSERRQVKILKKFLKEHSGVYLLSFEHADNGMPDFESFRQMCDFYLECIKNGYVLSAAAVIGKISDTLTVMRSDFECRLSESADALLEKSFCGIIVESSTPLRHGVFLGSTYPTNDCI